MIAGCSEQNNATIALFGLLMLVPAAAGTGDHCLSESL